jgi:hypothetical protein
MLVERLTVCASLLRRVEIANNGLGIGYLPLQTFPRGHQGLYQDLNIFHDRRPEATQIPPATL